MRRKTHEQVAENVRARKLARALEGTDLTPAEVRQSWAADNRQFGLGRWRWMWRRVWATR